MDSFDDFPLANPVTGSQVDPSPQAAVAPVPQDSAPSPAPSQQGGNWMASYLADTDKQAGLPPGTSANQIKAESNFNPNAVSKAGALGLAQVMPPTNNVLSKRVGYQLDPMNPQDALLMHRMVMTENMNHFKDPSKALMAYNNGWDPSHWNNPETQSYPGKILGAKSTVPAYQPPAPQGSFEDFPLANPMNFAESMPAAGNSSVPAAPPAAQTSNSSAPGDSSTGTVSGFMSDVGNGIKGIVAKGLSPTNIANNVAAVGEVPLALASGGIGQIIGDAVGSVTNNKDLANKVTDAITYSPRGPVSQKAMAAIGWAATPLTALGKAAGDAYTSATGSEMGGQIIDHTAQMLAGGAAIKGAQAVPGFIANNAGVISKVAGGTAAAAAGTAGTMTGGPIAGYLAGKQAYSKVAGGINKWADARNAADPMSPQNLKNVPGWDSAQTANEAGPQAGRASQAPPPEPTMAEAMAPKYDPVQGGPAVQSAREYAQRETNPYYERQRARAEAELPPTGATGGQTASLLKGGDIKATPEAMAPEPVVTSAPRPSAPAPQSVAEAMSQPAAPKPFEAPVRGADENLAQFRSRSIAVRNQALVDAGMEPPLTKFIIDYKLYKQNGGAMPKPDFQALQEKMATPAAPKTVAEVVSAPRPVADLVAEQRQAAATEPAPVLSSTGMRQAPAPQQASPAPKSVAEAIAPVKPAPAPKVAPEVVEPPKSVAEAIAPQPKETTPNMDAKPKSVVQQLRERAAQQNAELLQKAQSEMVNGEKPVGEYRVPSPEEVQAATERANATTYNDRLNPIESIMTRGRKPSPEQISRVIQARADSVAHRAIMDEINNDVGLNNRERWANKWGVNSGYSQNQALSAKVGIPPTINGLGSFADYTKNFKKYSDKLTADGYSLLSKAEHAAAKATYDKLWSERQ
jgi:hypothetical protein